MMGILRSRSGCLTNWPTRCLYRSSSGWDGYSSIAQHRLETGRGDLNGLVGAIDGAFEIGEHTEFHFLQESQRQQATWGAHLRCARAYTVISGHIEEGAS